MAITASMLEILAMSAALLVTNLMLPDIAASPFVQNQHALHSNPYTPPCCHTLVSGCALHHTVQP